MIFSFLLPFVKRKLKGCYLKVHGNSCSLLFCPPSSSQASGNLLPFQRPSRASSGVVEACCCPRPAQSPGHQRAVLVAEGSLFPAPVERGIVPSLPNGYYDNFLITDEAVMAVRVLFPSLPPTHLPLIFMLVSR